VQITRTTPFRRMILQLRQIFFTEANTFMFSSSQPLQRARNGAPPISLRRLVPVP
jgi:hypothetical protein